MGRRETDKKTPRGVGGTGLFTLPTGWAPALASVGCLWAPFGCVGARQGHVCVELAMGISLGGRCRVQG